MSEPNTQRYYVRRREFLNEHPDLPAFIIGIVEDTRHLRDDDPNQSWNHGDITLDLADCQRRVSFYFDMTGEAERANSLRKISIIAEVVNAVRNGIVLELASRNAREERIRKRAASEAQAPNESEQDSAREKSPAKSLSAHFITLGL
jgi:hypothetical protein